MRSDGGCRVEDGERKVDYRLVPRFAEGFLYGLGRGDVCLDKFAHVATAMKHFRTAGRAAIDYADAFRNLTPFQQLRDDISSYMT
jgi:hypothetical protein